jgi:hypothetical protein
LNNGREAGPTWWYFVESAKGDLLTMPRQNSAEGHGDNHLMLGDFHSFLRSGRIYWLYTQD